MKNPGFGIIEPRLTAILLVETLQSSLSKVKLPPMVPGGDEGNAPMGDVTPMVTPDASKAKVGPHPKSWGDWGESMGKTLFFFFLMNHLWISM